MTTPTSEILPSFSLLDSKLPPTNSLFGFGPSLISRKYSPLAAYNAEGHWRRARSSDTVNAGTIKQVTIINSGHSEHSHTQNSVCRQAVEATEVKVEKKLGVNLDATAAAAGRSSSSSSSSGGRHHPHR